MTQIIANLTLDYTTWVGDGDLWVTATKLSDAPLVNARVEDLDMQELVYNISCITDNNVIANGIDYLCCAPNATELYGTCNSYTTIHVDCALFNGTGPQVYKTGSPCLAMATKAASFGSIRQVGVGKGLLVAFLAALFLQRGLKTDPCFITDRLLHGSVVVMFTGTKRILELSMASR